MPIQQKGQKSFKKIEEEKNYFTETCHQKGNATKTEIYPKLEYHKNLNVTKSKKVTDPEILPKLKYLQNY